jgi:cohesin loading factor subunit SCC2
VQETAPTAELTDEHRGLALSSVSAGILMLLKAHLKGLYGLTEECVSRPLCAGSTPAHASAPRKCMKFVPGKKSALGDKPAVRKHEHPLAWERLPFATRPVLTSADAEAQKKTVSRLGCPCCSSNR